MIQRPGWQNVDFASNGGAPVGRSDVPGRAPIEEALGAHEAPYGSLLPSSASVPVTPGGSASTPVHPSLLNVVAVPLNEAAWDRGRIFDKADFALLPEAPGPLLDRTDASIERMAAKLGRPFDLASEAGLAWARKNDMRVCLPLFIRALEIQQSPGHEANCPNVHKLKISSVQRIADELAAHPQNPDWDGEQLFRLCAALMVDPRTIQYEGVPLDPQWYAAYMWSDDPAERDRRARQVLCTLLRTKVPARSVLFVRPEAPGTPVLDAFGSPVFTPEAKPVPVTYREHRMGQSGRPLGVPNWPSDKFPFADVNGFPILNHLAFRDGAPLYDPRRRTALATPDGQHRLVAEKPRAIPGAVLADYRVKDAQWAGALRGRAVWDVIPELPRPLGAETIPGEGKSAERYIDRLSLLDMARLVDWELLQVYQYKGGLPRALNGLSDEEVQAKLNIETRILELVDQGDLVEAFEKQKGENFGPRPVIDYAAYVERLPHRTSDERVASAALLKRLCNADRKRHGEIAYFDDKGRLGRTLEDVYSYEPTYPQHAMLDPAVYFKTASQLELDFGELVAAQQKKQEERRFNQLLAWARGPAFVGQNLALVEPSRDCLDGLFFVGESGAGKSTARHAFQDLAVAYGDCPKGKVNIDYVALRPALRAADNDGYPVHMKMWTKKPDGTFDYDADHVIPFGRLKLALKGYAVGFEEIGSNPNDGPRSEADRQLDAEMARLLMNLRDAGIKWFADGYDVASVQRVNVGLREGNRADVVTVTTPTRKAYEQTIARTLVRERQARRLEQSLSIDQDAYRWLVQRFENGKVGYGLRRRLNAMLMTAIDRAVARHSGVGPIVVDRRDLIGPVPSVETVESFSGSLLERDPPLFGLSTQIDEVQNVLRALRRNMQAGNLEPVRMMFETPPGTGMESLAQRTGEQLIAMGVAQGLVTQINSSCEVAWLGETRKYIQEELTTPNKVVVIDTRGWQVPEKNAKDGAAQNGKNALEEGRQMALTLLRNRAVACHLILLGDRTSIDCWTSGLANPEVAFHDGRISTYSVRDRSAFGYASDLGHLGPDALLEYFKYYLAEADAQFALDGVFQNAMSFLHINTPDQRLKRIFEEAGKDPNFEGEIFVEALVHRMVISAVAGLGEPIAEGPVPVKQIQDEARLMSEQLIEIADPRSASALRIDQGDLKGARKSLVLSRRRTFWEAVRHHASAFGSLIQRPFAAIDAHEQALRANNMDHLLQNRLNALVDEYRGLNDGERQVANMVAIARRRGMDEYLRMYRRQEIVDFQSPEALMQVFTSLRDEVEQRIAHVRPEDKLKGEKKQQKFSNKIAQKTLQAAEKNAGATVRMANAIERQRWNGRSS